jgi:hypothetical protein
MKIKQFLIIVIITCIGLSGCSFVDFTEFYFDEVNFRNDNVTFYSKTWNQVSTFIYLFTEEDKLRMICNWTWSNIENDKERIEKYKSNFLLYQQQLPMTTLKRRMGFCADKAFLIATIANYQLGTEMSVVTLKSTNKDNIIQHMVALFNGKAYDGMNGEVENLEDYCRDYKYQVMYITPFKNINIIMQRPY